MPHYFKKSAISSELEESKLNHITKSVPEILRQKKEENYYLL